MSLARVAGVAISLLVTSSARADTKPDYGPIETPQFEAQLRREILRGQESILFTSRSRAVFAKPPTGVLVLTPQRVLYVTWDRVIESYAAKLSLPWEDFVCVSSASKYGLLRLHRQGSHTNQFELRNAVGVGDTAATERAFALLDERIPYAVSTCPFIRSGGPFHHTASGVVIPDLTRSLARRDLIQHAESGLIRADFGSPSDDALFSVRLELRRLADPNATQEQDVEGSLAAQKARQPRYWPRKPVYSSITLFGAVTPIARIGLRGHNIFPDKVETAILHHDGWRLSITAQWMGTGSRGRVKAVDEVLAALATQITPSAASADSSSAPSPNHSP